MGMSFLSAAVVMFQTPSAGRWVLHRRHVPARYCILRQVSNPISGEVGAAARDSKNGLLVLGGSFKPHQRGGGCCSRADLEGRDLVSTVSNPISGEVGAAAMNDYQLRELALFVSNPISGEVGAAAGIKTHVAVRRDTFQTPSAGRWVLQPPKIKIK